MYVKFENEFAKKLYNNELTYATSGSAAFDLRACMEYSVEVPPNSTVKISSGIHAWLDNPDQVLICAPRSGLGTKGLVLANTVGVIDSDYQNVISIVLYNRTIDQTFTVAPGDRVCQVMVMPVLHPTVEYVNEFGSVTERGNNGFGSSGIK